MHGEETAVEVRCRCHKLICLVDGHDVHLKCGRCKRVLIIRTRGIESIQVGIESALPSPSAGDIPAAIIIPRRRAGHEGA